MKVVMLFVIMCSLFSCKTVDENKMSDDKLGPYDDVQFDGNSRSKSDVIALLDRVLKGQGDFGVYGDLSVGVDLLLKEMNIDVETKSDYYFVSVYSKGSSGGHDFSFSIDRNTEKLSDVVIGEDSPAPDFDD